MLRCYQTLLIIMLTSVTMQAQTDTVHHNPKLPYPVYREKAWKLLVGASLQSAQRDDESEYTRKYLEIGIHRTLTNAGRAHPESVITHGIALEVAPGKHTIVGFRYGGWLEGNLFVFGISGIYYTDFEQGNFKIRPEIGIGAYPFKFTIGYNIPTIANRDFETMRKANLQLSLNVLLKLRVIKREDF